MWEHREPKPQRNQQELNTQKIWEPHIVTSSLFLFPNWKEVYVCIYVPAHMSVSLHACMHASTHIGTYVCGWRLETTVRWLPTFVQPWKPSLTGSMSWPVSPRYFPVYMSMAGIMGILVLFAFYVGAGVPTQVFITLQQVFYAPPSTTIFPVPQERRIMCPVTKSNWNSMVQKDNSYFSLWLFTHDLFPAHVWRSRASLDIQDSFRSNCVLSDANGY